jgi:hypothetical protein
VVDEHAGIARHAVMPPGSRSTACPRRPRCPARGSPLD